jgi:hypothetical protein
MPQYTFHVDPMSGGEPSRVVKVLENDEVAVHVARRMLGVDGACVRVGRGAGEDVKWLGAWEAQSRRAAWREEGDGR